MTKSVYTLLAVLLAAFLLIGCQEKAEAAPYVKAGIGITDYDYDDPLADFFFDNSATAFSIAIGHQTPWLSWLSGELEYTDFGNASKNIFGVTTGFDVSGWTAWAVGDWNVATIAGMPLGLSARAGITSASADATVGIVTISANDTGFAYGAGAKLWVMPATAVTVDVTKRNLNFSVGGSTFGYDPTVAMLSVQHQF